MFKASEEYIKKLKEMEGFRPSRYDDRGKVAIGYGDTEGDSSRPITEEEADRRLRARLEAAGKDLDSIVTRKDLSQAQKDMLLDMHYNLGADTFKSGSVINLVNAGQDELVANKVLEYDKSTNPNTGVREVLPGLQRRAQTRRDMWLSNGTPSSATRNNGLVGMTPELLSDDTVSVNQDTGVVFESGSLNEDAKIDLALNNLNSVENASVASAPVPMTEDQLIDSALNTYEAEQARTYDPDMSKNITTMGLSSNFDSVTPEDAKRYADVRKLSREASLSVEDAAGVLAIMSREDFDLQRRVENLATNYPAVARWAQDPNNFNILKSTGTWAQKLENAARALSERSDFAKAWDNSMINVESSLTLTGMVLGAIPREAGKERLNALNVERAKNVYNAQAGIDEIEQARKNLNPAIVQFLDSAGQAWNTFFPSAMYSLTEDARKNYDKSDASFDKVLELAFTLGKDGLDVGEKFASWMYSYLSNMDAYAARTVESAGTSLIPAAIGLGGKAVGATVGALTVNPALAAGIIASSSLAAFGSGAALEFGGKFQEFLADYVNPQTGEIDYDRAFNDAEKMKEWRAEAAIYGLTMGTFDALYTNIAGKFFLKNAGKGGVAGAAKALGGEVAVSGLSEGASEFSASSLVDIYKGNVTKESIADNLTRSVDAGLSAAPMGGVLGPIGAGVNTFIDSVPRWANKISGDVREANEANARLEKISKLRFTRAENEASTSSSDQVNDLVSEAMASPNTNDMEIDLATDVNKLSFSEARTMEREAVQGSVLISPQELYRLAVTTNKNFDAVVSALPNSVAQELLNNLNDDKSVRIDAATWVAFTDSVPEADAIARINGGELNGVEANERLEGYQEDPFSLLQTIPPEDSSTPPSEIPISEDTSPRNEVFAGSQPEGEMISIDGLRRRFADPEDQRALNTVTNKVNQMISRSPNIPREVGQLFGEIQYRRLKQRAEALGVPVNDLADAMKTGVGEREGARGWYNRIADIVFMTRDADPSTVVHEFAHSWLDEMAEDFNVLKQVGVGNFNQAQADLYEAGLELGRLFGVDDISTLADMSYQDPEYLRVSESFAQTAEEYFLNGNYQNNRVAHVMERLRKFLVDIIDRVAASYRQFPALEVSPRVNRMFSQILGTSNKAEEFVVPMFVEPMFDPANLGSRAQEYFNTSRDALNEAVGKVASRIMNASFREREAIIDQFYNEAYDTAQQEIDSRPVMMLRAQMMDLYNEYRVKKQRGETVADPRISYSSFLDAIGDVQRADALRAAIPSFMIGPKKGGGISLENMMVLTGSSSIADFVEGLVQMGRRDRLIELTANKLIEGRYPIVKSDAEIRDEAVQAISEGGTSRLLNMEMDILAKNYLPTLRGTAEMLITPDMSKRRDYMRAKAEQLVNQSKAYKFSANTFRADFMRFGRESARAFRRGDFASAFDYKQKSVISLRAHRNAISAQRQMAKTKNTIKQFQKYALARGFEKQYDVDVMGYGLKVLDSILRSGTTPPNFQVPSDIRGFTGVTYNLEAGINQAVEGYLARAEGPVSQENISVENYIALGDLLTVIKTAARKSRQIEVAGRRLDLQETAATTASEINNSQSPVRDYSQEGIAGSYRASMTKAETVLASLYPSREDWIRSNLGTSFQSLRQSEADSALEKRQVQADITKAIRSSVMKRYKNNKAIMRALAPFLYGIEAAGNRVGLFSSAKWDMTGLNKPVLGGSELPGVTFKNMWDYHFAELLMGSESGARKLILNGNGSGPWGQELGGGRVDESGFQALRQRLINEGRLVKEDFDMYQEIWDTMKALHPRVKQTIRETDVFYIGEVEGRNVVTPFGTYTGGYVPVSPMKSFKERNRLSAIIDPDTNHFSATDLYPRQRMGNTKERTDAKYPVDLDMSKLFLYTNAAVDIIHLRKPLTNLGKLLASPDVVEALEAKRPGALGRVVIPWFDRTRSQQYTVVSDNISDTISRHLKFTSNMSLYLGNLILTPGKQMLGLFPTASQVGSYYTSKNLLQTVANPKDSFAHARDNSSIMRERLNNMIRDMVRSWDEPTLDFDWASQFTRFSQQRLPYYPIQFMQNIVDVSTFNAGYEFARAKQGMTHSEAVAFAENMLENTQGSHAVSSLVNFQSGTDLNKLISMTTTHPITMSNLMTTEAARQPDAINRVRAVITLGWMAWLLPQILDTEMSLMFFKEDDRDSEEEKEKKRDELRIERNLLGMVGMKYPMVDSALGVFSEGVRSLSPGLSVVDNMAVGGRAMKNINQDVPLTPREMAALLKTLTVITGQPFSFFSRDFFVEDVYTEFLKGETLDDIMLQRRLRLNELKFEDFE